MFRSSYLFPITTKGSVLGISGSTRDEEGNVLPAGWRRHFDGEEKLSYYTDAKVGEEEEVRARFFHCSHPSSCCSSRRSSLHVLRDVSTGVSSHTVSLPLLFRDAVSPTSLSFSLSLSPPSAGQTPRDVDSAANRTLRGHPRRPGRGRCYGLGNCTPRQCPDGLVVTSSAALRRQGGGCSGCG